MTPEEKHQAYLDAGQMIHKGRKVAITWLPFPDVNGIGGALIEDKEYYLIAINSALAQIRQRHALGHELAHLFLDHLDRRDIPIMLLEKQANRYAWTFYNAYKRGDLSKEIPARTIGRSSTIIE